MAHDMTNDRDDTDDRGDATMEPAARQALSVAFTDGHDQRLAVGGPDAEAFGGGDASDHSWGLGGGDRLGGGAEDDVLSGGVGRDLLSRSSATSVDARIVSPMNTGAGMTSLS